MPDMTSTHAHAPRRADGGDAVLTVVRGSAVGHRSTLSPGEFVIGRAEDADLCLRDAGISRRHAMVVRNHADVVSIIDLASTNGVFVNGQPRDVAVLQVGDAMALGPHVGLRFGPPPHVEGVTQPHAGWIEAVLSARERQVAGLAARGWTSPRIGRELGLGRRTVESHLGRTYTKLGVGGRSELIRLWVGAAVED